jgi:hypothetical protein
MKKERLKKVKKRVKGNIKKFSFGKVKCPYCKKIIKDLFFCTYEWRAK